MNGLPDRLRAFDELAPAQEVYRAAQQGSRRSDAEMSRPIVTRIVTVVAALAIGLGAVAVAMVAFRPSDDPPPVAVGRGILAPAPSECPIGRILPFIRGAPPIDPSELAARTMGYLPSWLPDGFGLLHAYGPEPAADGSAATAIWADERCREVTLSFNPSWKAAEPGTVYDPESPQVGQLSTLFPPDDPPPGPWSVVTDEPDGCENAILGRARCLGYVATTVDGTIALQMMGLDREEGDRIVLSILNGGEPGGDGVAVPDLVGAKAQPGLRALDEAGLRWVAAGREVDGVEHEHVASQDPSPGTSVDPGTEVRVVISTEVTPLPDGAADALNCPPAQHEAFGGPRIRILPGGAAYISGNLAGIRRNDRMHQVTFGDREWEGVWHVIRDGSVVAAVDFDTLDGAACRDSGVAGA